MGEDVGALALEVLDETGAACDLSAEEELALYCQWAAGATRGAARDKKRAVNCRAQLFADGTRLRLPPLAIAAGSAAGDALQVMLRLASIGEMRFEVKVEAEAGAPARLQVALLEGAGATVGEDTTLKLTVCDARGVRVLPEEGRARMRLENLMIEVRDEAGEERVALARREDFARSTQTYTQENRAAAEWDPEGFFLVKYIRLPGRAGAVTVAARADLVLLPSDTSQSSGGREGAGPSAPERVPNISGEAEVQLAVGRASRLRVRGQEEVDTAGRERYVELECVCGGAVPPLAVQAVDDSGNVVPEWQGKGVTLNLTDSGLAADALDCSAKRSGESRMILALEASKGGAPGEDGGRVATLEQLRVHSAGTFVGTLACRGLESPLLLRLIVRKSNRVVGVALVLAEAEVEAGGAVGVRVALETEDGEALPPDLAMRSVSFFVREARGEELVASNLDYDHAGGDLFAHLEAPVAAGDFSVVAVYREDRGEHHPEASSGTGELESADARLRVVPGRAARIQLRHQRVYAAPDGAGALALRGVAVEVVDAHGNTAALDARGSPLSVSLRPSVSRMQGGDLVLEGGAPAVLTAESNPVAFERLRLVHSQGDTIDKAEVYVVIEVKSEDQGGLEGSDALQIKVGFTDDALRQSRMNEKLELETRLNHLEFDLADRRKRLDALNAQAPHSEVPAEASADVDEAEGELQTLRSELNERANSEPAESAEHGLQLKGLSGVVGPLARLGVIDRRAGVEARAVQAAVSQAAQTLLRSVLFESDDALAAFDALTAAEKRRTKIPRVYSRESLPPQPKVPRRPNGAEGFVAFASELVKVDAQVLPQHVDAARLLLDLMAHKLLIFDTYAHAAAFFKAHPASRHAPSPEPPPRCAARMGSTTRLTAGDRGRAGERGAGQGVPGAAGGARPPGRHHRRRRRTQVLAWALDPEPPPCSRATAAPSRPISCLHAPLEPFESVPSHRRTPRAFRSCSVQYGESKGLPKMGILAFRSLLSPLTLYVNCALQAWDAGFRAPNLNPLLAARCPAAVTRDCGAAARRRPGHRCGLR